MAKPLELNNNKQSWIHLWHSTTTSHRCHGHGTDPFSGVGSVALLPHSWISTSDWLSALNQRPPETTTPPNSSSTQEKRLSRCTTQHQYSYAWLRRKKPKTPMHLAFSGVNAGWNPNWHVVFHYATFQSQITYPKQFCLIALWSLDTRLCNTFLVHGRQLHRPRWFLTSSHPWALSANEYPEHVLVTCSTIHRNTCTCNFHNCWTCMSWSCFMHPCIC